MPCGRRYRFCAPERGHLWYNRIMRRKLLFAMGLAVAGIIYSPAVFAQTGSSASFNIEGFLKIICRASDILFTVLMAGGIIILLAAGFAFMTAGGSPERLSNARKLLFYGIIGIALALMAKSLLFIVADYFEVRGLSVCEFAPAVSS